jgi:asparagine synthase (glutamine-hydrolysing)
MCGIVGKYYFQQRPFVGDDIAKMMEAIHHRGPDSSGKFEDGHAFLGFQRLSIIDTLSGHQPLYNESKSLVLLANGEIYNYKDFVPLLQSKGHVFTTRSDCEVILHLYEEYGIGFIAKLNGMFAFCLYDTHKKLLYIARDRVGIKPLYYHLNDECMVFGSEIKGILAAENVPTNETAGVLAEYLCFRYLANFRTFFSSIQALEPGAYLEISQDGCKSSRFWDYSNYALGIEDDRDLIAAIDTSLTSSVKRQMMTDVPLGTQLSGGVDSSLVSNLAAGFAPGLKAFTVSFFESAYDESSYARLLADSTGLEYHQVRVDGKTFADNLPKVIWYHDEPLCHANSVHMYLLCKYARQHVKVLLTGEGADELFAGYPRYMICRFGEIFNGLNSHLASMMRAVLQGIPVRKISKVAENLGLTSRDLVLWNSSFAKKDKVSWLMGTGEISFEARSALVDRVWNTDLSLFDNLLLYEQQSYLQPILMRQDKMSMAASIESRVPVLDNEMLNLANSIPFRYKIKNLTPKHVFKKVAERHISRKIVYKKKVGFGVPIDEWLRDHKGLGRYLDQLRDPASGIDGIDKSKVEQLITEHLDRGVNHGDVLWPLINYIIWKEQFFKN